MTSGGGQPGARVGRLIERAAPQLRQFANLALPSVLVVYDNIVVNGQRPRGGYSIHLESSFIDFGMYGLQTVVCKVVQTPVAPRLVPVSDGRGGERQMTEDERVYISAVAVLQEHHESRDPYLVTYHNYFACRPLPPAALRGGDDRHFEKPSHPNTSPQEWREIL
jgi:hypothetical protein